MTSWWIGILLVCALLAGCGGGKKRAVKPPPAASVEFTQNELRAAEQEESLAEQLSEKRLEELLAKSGLQREDPVLEEELKKWDQAIKIDVPVAINKQVKAYLVYFTTERKNVIQKYLTRSTRYLPMIREVFQEHGLPEDLAYLAMIESGFNPYAYSHAHASGMWQFIQGTGRRYGLTINNYLDERRDPIKSTQAAAQYLLDLYKQFGSWYLAAASYNCGEGRVQREINASTHKNFWDLSANQCLPNETKNYVPQMIAATIIAKNPEKFGFKNVPYLPPLQYDTVKVTEPTSLKAAAIACNIPQEEIALLNPELRKGMTPPDQPQYLLNIPKKSKELFLRNIQLAKIEAPAHASESVQTERSFSRSNYPSSTKKTSSNKVTKSTKSSKKNASRAAASSASAKRSATRTAQASKAKAGSSKQPESAVQVGSMLAVAKTSQDAKANVATGKKQEQEQEQGTRSTNSDKKSRKKPTKEKSSSLKSPQPSAEAGGQKEKETATSSGSQGRKGSKEAKSRKKNQTPS